MTNKTLGELKDLVKKGGLLLLSFVTCMAFWITLFLKVGVVWTVVLFLLHALYEYFARKVWGK